MLQDQLKIFYPQNPLLRKHIVYYYFIQTEADFYSHYFSFPNMITSFNIHRQVYAKIDQSRIAVSHDLSNDYMIILQGKYTIPLEIELSGCLDKVTIGFKPGGINYFMKCYYGDIAPDASQIFTAWDNEIPYRDFLADFYRQDDLSLRVGVLEDFLVSVYRPVPEGRVLADALNRLSDIDKLDSITAIAQQLGINIRTFCRLFRRYVGISPDAYRQVCRFRRSMDVKLFNDRLISLTEACYQANFYDQSYFNKLYRKATGTNPGKFFSQVVKLAEDNLVFKIKA